MAILDHVGVDHLVEKISEEISNTNYASKLAKDKADMVYIMAESAFSDAYSAKTRADEAYDRADEPNNIEIIYTTSDGKPLLTNGSNYYIRKDTYVNGRGVLVVKQQDELTKSLTSDHLGSSRRLELTSIILPHNYFTDMSGTLFANCTKLETIEIPDNIITIGSQAFAYCSSLKTVKLSNNLSVINIYEFSGCTSLETIEIPDSVTLIKEGAFYNCNNLKNIKIGSGVTSIGKIAFYNCKVVNSYEIHAITPPSLGASVFNGAEDYKIYVPLESVDAYKQAENWTTYADRIVGVVFEDENIVPGENIKTINGESILGSGNIDIVMEGDYLPLSGGTVNGTINCKSIFINYQGMGLAIDDSDGGPLISSEDPISFDSDEFYLWGSSSGKCLVDIDGDLNFSGSMSSGTIEGGTW